MENGWVKLHRQLFESPLWLSDSFTKGQAWVDLFGCANHKDGRFWKRGIEVQVKRGQIGWSEVTMARRWRWSRTTVRLFLKWLESAQQIRQEKTRLTSIITILNYDKYQDPIQQNGQQTVQQKNNRLYNRLYTNKNDKKNKKEKNGENKDLAAEAAAGSEPPKISELDPRRIVGSDWNKYIDAFASVNAMYLKFYSNKTERGAIQEVVDAKGRDRALEIIKGLYETNQETYAPKITSPSELVRKLGQLEAFLGKKKTSSSFVPSAPVSLGKFEAVRPMMRLQE